MIFALEYADFECTRYYFFEGPEKATKEKFEKLCKKLLGEAAKLAIKKQGNITPEKEESDWESFIGWSAIIDALCSILPNHGYKTVKLPTVTYVGNPIIMDKKKKNDGESKGLPADVRQMIIDYNQKLMNRHKKGKNHLF